MSHGTRLKKIRQALAAERIQENSGGHAKKPLRGCTRTAARPLTPPAIAEYSTKSSAVTARYHLSSLIILAHKTVFKGYTWEEWAIFQKSS